MAAESKSIDEAVLALLWLNLEATGIAWKGFAWDAMERLHQRGLISKPGGQDEVRGFERRWTSQPTAPLP